MAGWVSLVLVKVVFQLKGGIPAGKELPVGPAYSQVRGGQSRPQGAHEQMWGGSCGARGLKAISGIPSGDHCLEKFYGQGIRRVPHAIWWIEVEWVNGLAR